MNKRRLMRFQLLEELSEEFRFLEKEKKKRNQERSLEISARRKRMEKRVKGEVSAFEEIKEKKL